MDTNLDTGRRPLKNMTTRGSSLDAAGEGSLSREAPDYTLLKVDGDILILRPEQERASRQIACEVMSGSFGDPRNDRLVGSIFGRSGAGKSEVTYFFRDFICENGVALSPSRSTASTWRLRMCAMRAAPPRARQRR